MKVLITICRILVGSLFIVSGMIKVNDVIGFGYKLEEYFAETALNFPSLTEYVIPIAIFIVIGEVLLGVALLLGAWPKVTTSLILFMTVFFLWLTNYTASCIDRRNDFKPSAEVTSFPDTCVETCGCFGDAIPLEPRESFWKDVILLIFVIPVFFAAWRNMFKLNTWQEDAYILVPSLIIIALFSVLQLEWFFPVVFTVIAAGIALLIKRFAGRREWLMALAVLLVCGYVQCHTYYHLPLKDYRAYAIGNDIREKMKTSEQKLSETEFARFVNEKVVPLTGDTVDFTSNIGDPATIDEVGNFLSAAMMTNPAASQAHAQLLADSSGWKKEIAMYQPPKFVSVYTLKNTGTGELKEMNSDDYLAQKVWQDKSWEIQKELTVQKKIRDGYIPKISDFNPVTQDGEEVKETLLNEPRVFLMISKNVETMDMKHIPQIVEFSKAAQADGAKFYGISPASGEMIENLRFNHQMPFDFLVNDMTELKIIVRSNPGLVYIENGVVVNMWSHGDIPDYKEAKANGFQ